MSTFRLLCWCWMSLNHYIEHSLHIDSDRGPKVIFTDLDLALTQYYEQQWHDKLHRQQTIRRPGQNKLRTLSLSVHLSLSNI